ncbi:MAG: hypothetical protein JNL08_10315 [Planctomycetes bacterium]|nr:hypothetical protein [Planctomycetota bacterium]
MNHVSLSRCAAAAAFFLGSAFAQAEPGSGPVTLVRHGTAPIHTGADDGGQPYGVWAVGDGYKVGFAGGLQFVPYTGRGDGPSPAWRWRTASARVGALELVTAEPNLRYGDWRAEYDLGAVVEAYDVRADGVEQTFVLREPPRAAGDLVIRGAVESLLSARPVANGVEYADANGVPRVHYGAAVAVDARGDRQVMSTTVVDGGIELRLDGGWLATAAFPLVVDPLVAPLTVTTGTPIDEVAVAHDPLGSKNLWFAEVRYVGADADLLLWRADADGDNPVLVSTDVSASWSSIEPALGVNRPGASTILAWTRDILAGGERYVRLHVHDRADLGFDATVLYLSVPGGRNCWRPTVGHELSPVSFTSSLVAFQVEGTGGFANLSVSEIHAAVIACGGNGSIVTTFPVAAGVGIDHERPSLAKVDVGPTREWTVAYQRYTMMAGGFEWDIGLRRIDQANVVGAEYLIPDGGIDQHEMAPVLAGTDDRLLLFCTASDGPDTIAKPNGRNGHRILGTRIDWNGAAFTTPHGTKVLQQNADPRLELGGADLDLTTRSHWALSFRSNVTQNVYLRVYGYTASELWRDDVDAPTTGLGTSIGGGVCYLGDEGDFAVAYGIDDPGVGSYGRLRRHFFGAPSSYHFGFGCTTTEIDWFGPRWIGSEFAGVEFSGAPANSFTFALVALAPASLQLYGFGGVHDGCWLYVPLSGPDYVMMTSPIVGTDGAWPLPLTEWLDSDLLYFQGVTFDANVGEFFSTNRLIVPIAK